MKPHIEKLYIKIIIVNIVDVLLIATTIFFLTKLPAIAIEISKVHGQALAGEQSSEGAVIKADLDNNKEKIEELSDLFLDDTGLVNFNEEVAKLKAAGVVTDASFVSTTPVTDATLARGLPILFKASGTKEQVNNAVKEITNLPALIRPVTVKLTTGETGWSLEYGVFVYIK